MKTKIELANSAHEAAYQDMVALLRKHNDDIDAIEMLAIAANMIGKLIALQDQRKFTAPMLLELVQKNIELGNQQALAEINSPKGNA